MSRAGTRKRCSRPLRCPRCMGHRVRVVWPRSVVRVDYCCAAYLSQVAIEENIVLLLSTNEAALKVKVRAICRRACRCSAKRRRCSHIGGQRLRRPCPSFTCTAPRHLQSYEEAPRRSRMGVSVQSTCRATQSAGQPRTLVPGVVSISFSSRPISGSHRLVGFGYAPTELDCAIGEEANYAGNETWRRPRRC